MVILIVKTFFFHVRGEGGVAERLSVRHHRYVIVTHFTPGTSQFVVFAFVAQKKLFPRAVSRKPCLIWRAG